MNLNRIAAGALLISAALHGVTPDRLPLPTATYNRGIIGGPAGVDRRTSQQLSDLLAEDREPLACLSVIAQDSAEAAASAQDVDVAPPAKDDLRRCAPNAEVATQLVATLDAPDPSAVVAQWGQDPATAEALTDHSSPLYGAAVHYDGNLTWWYVVVIAH